MYDTICTLNLKTRSLECLSELIQSATQGMIGVCVGGESMLQPSPLLDWGSAIGLHDGSLFYLRAWPPSAIKAGSCSSRTVLLATRRCKAGEVPTVTWAVLFTPRDHYIMQTNTPVTNGGSVGCKAVHILLPGLLHKHSPHRFVTQDQSSLDPRGYMALGASTLMVRNIGADRLPAGIFVSPGTSYLVLAAHLWGVDLDGDVNKAASEIDSDAFALKFERCQNAMAARVGQEETCRAANSALTIVELLSSEGFLALRSNAFFRDSHPDLLVSPSGLPLLVVMSVQLALNPERFNLPPCTSIDAFSNREMASSFESRWTAVTPNGFRAIDVAIKVAFDSTFVNAAKKKCSFNGELLRDNLLFWQRVGQRIITKLQSDPRDECRPCHDGASHFDTPYGFADLLHCPISEAKFEAYAKRGHAASIPEVVIDKVVLASRTEALFTLRLMQDEVENWLRTGMMGGMRLSHENPKPQDAEGQPAGKPAGKLAGQAEAAGAPKQGRPAKIRSDEASSILNQQLCEDAVDSAGTSIQTALTYGTFAAHSKDFSCFAISDAIKAECAYCDSKLTVMEGCIFRIKDAECPHCNRVACFKCARASERPARCLRCRTA